MLSRPLALASAVVLLAVSATASQQTSNPRTSAAPTTTTLTGCVSGAPVNSGEFTFTDPESGSQFRLSGKSMRKFAGRRVEIVGGPRGKGLSIRGGLWPSPNVAAQSGAIDPAQASIARQPGGGGGGAAAANLPEFHVVRVRGVEGACQ